jgi:hypothetical protein
MEALNVLIGILFLTVVYALVDNYKLRSRVRSNDSIVQDMFIALSALKEFTIEENVKIKVLVKGEQSVTDNFLNALERLDQRISLLEPKVESERKTDVNNTPDI